MLCSLRKHADIPRTQKGGPELAERTEQRRSQYKLSVRLHWVSALNSGIDVDESGSHHPKKTNAPASQTLLIFGGISAQGGGFFFLLDFQRNRAEMCGAEMRGEEIHSDVGCIAAFS